MSAASAVLVDVTWQDRILSSYGISRLGAVFMGGGDDADVRIPVFSPKDKVQILRIADSGVYIKDPARGEFYLRPGETARIGLANNLLSLRVRQIHKTQTAKAMPFFDLTSTEAVGIVLAIAISAILGVYMNIYTPSSLRDEEATLIERISKAKVTFQMPAEKSQAVKKDQPSQEAKSTASSKPPSIARAPRIKPNSQPGSLLSAFGAKGINETMSKTFSEGNSLVTAAGKATGRAGDFKMGGIHGQLIDTRSGRDGKTVALGSLGTAGRNNGGTGYRAGGLSKGATQISVAGADANFEPGMDREAIRRVIREHLREIRNCYERELQRQPDLYGKLVISWDIESGGRVSNAGVKDNSTGNARIGECLVAALRSWTFPDPPKNQIGRISYPFVFSAQ